jgi:hypothetical protein
MDRRRNSTVVGVALAVGIAGATATAIVFGLAMSGENQAATPTVDTGVARAIPVDVYDPVRAGETTPTGFRQVLGRDQIAPIYDPIYTTPDDVDWPDDSLVLGIAGAETAKAFPITHLNQREMVVDSLEGIPVLDTW